MGRTLNANAFESPPPGAGLKTVTCTVPTLTMSVAGIAAVNCVAVTNVGRALPFHRTTEPGMKFEPVIVNANAGPPAFALDGARELMTGAGLRMLNKSEFELPPPGGGFNTDICTFPTTATSPAGIVAVNCVLLTKVVVRLFRFH